MHCLCNHSHTLICVISFLPLPRSCYLPFLIPLVRDFQGPGSESPFSPFSPGGLIIRIQPYSLKLMFLIQSQQSISKHPFLFLPTLFQWGGGRLEKGHVHVFMYPCACTRINGTPLWPQGSHLATLDKNSQVHTHAPKKWIKCACTRTRRQTFSLFCKCTKRKMFARKIKNTENQQNRKIHDPWRRALDNRGKNEVFTSACFLSLCARGESMCQLFVHNRTQMAVAFTLCLLK